MYSTCAQAAAHVRVLPPHLLHQDHRQGLGREVEDCADDEVQEQTP